MEKTVFYNGYVYKIELIYSKNYYGCESVYHIKTDNPKWAASILPKVMEDDSISIGEYKTLNKRNPCFENYLKKHHKVQFIEDLEDKIFEGYYEYRIITPYDD